MTPFSWSVPSAVNQHVADLARELKARGHLPVVVVSSDDLDDERRVTRSLPSHPRPSGHPARRVSPRRGARPAAAAASRASVRSNPRRGSRWCPLGSSLPVRLNGGVANLGLPVDVTSRLEKLMLGADFDLVHVHEPLAPSLSFTALREARSPVVATFHLTPVGVAAYELGQSVLDRFFLRLDARIVTFPARPGDDGRPLSGRVRGRVVRYRHRPIRGAGPAAGHDARARLVAPETVRRSTSIAEMAAVRTERCSGRCWRRSPTSSTAWPWRSTGRRSLAGCRAASPASCGRR